MSGNRLQLLRRRHLRVRRKVSGTAERPRLCIHKSLKHLYAQIVDDTDGRTVCSVTTNTKARKGEAKNLSNMAWASKLGKEMAGRAVEKGVGAVIFDRGGYRYHGVVKAFADAVREGGLKF
jgi:large subunit ribosomal protein L18